MALGAPLALKAQTASSLTGHVRAADGKFLSGVKVVVQNSGTTARREAVTGEGGRYVFAALAPGEYELRAEATGFRLLKRTGVHLTVGETAVLDLGMELGALEQEITVTGRAPLVNTKTSELSYLVEEGAIQTLPLNGRNYTDLALLQPGVVAYPHRDGGSAVAHGLGLSMNGQDYRSNVYLLDGTPMNDFTNGPAGSAASTVLGMETIREFRVETNVYSAEFGRNSGGQINALTKSGTNALHGSLYEYLRNDNMDARNFFDRTGRPEFKRNQYGGSFGGPIKRDKAFLFAGYEGLRERLGRTVTSVTPDANAHNGLIPNPAAPGQLLNVGVNPAVQPYLNEMPIPNAGDLGTGLGRYTFGFGQTLRQDFGQVRYDHNFGDKGQFFVRYTVDDASQRLPVEFPQFPRFFQSRNQFITAEHTIALSASTLNTLRGGFSRTRIGQDVEANTASKLQPFVSTRGLVGNIDIGGASRFGPQGSVNLRLTQNVYTLEDHVSLIRGRHTIKLGGLMEHYQDNMQNPTFSLGIYTFADIRAFLENRPLRFLGLGPEGAIDRYWRFTLFGGFVQDSWSVTPRLTLNLGLRYETTTMPVDKYGRDSALPDLLAPTPTTGRLYSNPPRKNFSPRFGFAWDPTGSGRTSVRGGAGIFVNTNNQQNLIVTVTNPPATPRYVITSNVTFPNPPFDRGVGNTMRPIEWNIKNPNIYMWNLNVQHQLPGQFLLTLGYAGTRGIHLMRNTDINTPEPTRLADGTLFWAAGLPRPNRSFSTIELKKSDGNSWYNAAIFEVRKRWSHGFNFQSSYTFSRNIDTTQSSTFFSDATNGMISAMPEYSGFSYNKGLADFHAKHNWLLNFAWEVPFAKKLTGVSRAILDGWQLAGIHNLRSGSPLTLFVQANRSRSQWGPSIGPGLGLDRPSMVPGFTHESAIIGSPDQWFNPAAFRLQPAGTLGDLGRGSLIGPNLRAFDASAMKNFRCSKLGEGGAIQFRVEAFNLFNRANFGAPRLLAFAGAADNEPAQGSLGLIQNTVTTSRQVQLSLRVQF
ncbi:MAG: TonB-dependent receptor [Acidobacteriota bacterium]